MKLVECKLCGTMHTTPLRDREICLDCVMELFPCSECGNEYINMDQFKKEGGGEGFIILCRECNNFIKGDDPKLLYAIWQSFNRVDSLENNWGTGT